MRRGEGASQSYPRLGRSAFAQALTERSALLRCHLPPAAIVFHHALALLRRQLLEALVAAHDLLAALGRQLFETLVGLAQLVAALLGKLTPSAQSFEQA